MNLQLDIIAVGLVATVSINLWGIYKTKKRRDRLEMESSQSSLSRQDSMFRTDRARESRGYLLLAAAVGLLLMESHALLDLTGRINVASKLLGNILFIYSFWRVCNQQETGEQAFASSKRRALVSGFSGLALLAMYRFVPTSTKLHALFAVLGCFLLFVCLYLPKSRLQEYVFIGAYAIVLSTVPWKTFSVFATMDPYVLAALMLLWIVVTGSIFLFLMHRKSQISPPALH